MIDIRKKCSSVDPALGLPTFIIFILYLLTVLYFTVLTRPIGLHTAQFELFWSYRAAFAGDFDLGREIIANIAMFVPFGFLASCLLQTYGRLNRRMLIITAIVGMIASLTIEILQLVFMRGLFEWDDVFSNTIGAVVGIIIFYLLLRMKKYSVIIHSISGVFAVICVVVILTGRGITDVEADITPRMFWFEVDGVEITDDTVTLNGTAVRYDHEEEQPEIILRSTDTGKRVKLSTVASRETSDYLGLDVNSFSASGKITNTSEFEVMIRWPWTMTLSTGAFISGSDIHYYQLEDLVEPNVSNAPELRDIVENGILRVYRPDFHCWVYQKDWSLYWIVDQDFDFEDDGSTYIQYQLWTTQMDKLPEKRLENNWLWDNIGGYFEDYELEGNFGPYRVMKRDIPTAYPVTAIETGYYKKGAWIWKDYFRPVR